MNTVSLNSLWSYLQSLNLTASNRAWLADRLYESAPVETKADKILAESYKMKTIDQLSPELRAIIGFAKPIVEVDDDINGDDARLEYLTEKYGL